MEDKRSKLNNSDEQNLTATQIEKNEAVNSRYFDNEFSKMIWEQTYKAPSDKNVEDTFHRVAEFVSSVETSEDLREKYKDKFFNHLSSFKIVPGGRILANAGAGYKNTSLLNCFVSPKEKYDMDSIEGIYLTLKKQAQTLKSEGGWGFNAGFIRPRGAFIKGIGVGSPGVVKFLELFDKSAEIITEGCSTSSTKSKKKIRKGAMMVCLPCLAGNTPINTINGKEKIENLVGKKPFVYCTDGKGGIFVRQATKVWKSGFKKTVKVKFDDDSELICTPDHLIMLKSGDYVSAKDLKFGDSVCAFHKVLMSKDYISIGVTGARLLVPEHIAVAEMKYGRYPNVVLNKNRSIAAESEDVHHIDNNKLNNNPDNLMLLRRDAHARLHTLSSEHPFTYHRKRIAKERIGKKWSDVYGDEKANTRIKKHKETLKKCKYRPWNEGMSLHEYKSRYLNGFKNQFSTEDGIKHLEDKRNSQVGAYIFLYNKLNRKPMRKEWALYCKDHQISYDIRSTSKSKISFHSFKELVEEAENKIKKHGLEPLSNHKVISVTEHEEMDVYDMEVPGFHNFAANNVFVHNCSHPSIYEFIRAKQVANRLTKFNMSVAISNEFMDRLIKLKDLDKDDPEYEKLNKWDLIFPETTFEKFKEEWDGNIDVWKSKGYPIKVYDTTTVTEIWDSIMKSTYNRAEPGVLFIDRFNETYPANYLGQSVYIDSTNPCGELGLSEGLSCALTSVNLTKFVNLETRKFEYGSFTEAVRTAVRFIDNVIDVANPPLKQYDVNMKRLRRIGVGLMGVGSTSYLLGVRYASREFNDVFEMILKTYVESAIEESVDIAIEKGAFDGCNNKKHASNLKKLYPWLPESTIERVKEHGIRNSSLFTIPPNGNTGIFANEVSGGVEPVFDKNAFIRTVGIPEVPKQILDKAPRYWEGVFEENADFKMVEESKGQFALVHIDEYGAKWKIYKDRGMTKEILCQDYGMKTISKYNLDTDESSMATAHELSPDEHLAVLDLFAKYLDASCSKTINCPRDIKYEDFKDIYLKAYKTGHIKGVTTYRDGTMADVIKKKCAESEESRLVSKENPIVKTNAIKRPKELKCDVHLLTRKGEHYYVIVGLLGNDPYEVFVGVNETQEVNDKGEYLGTKPIFTSYNSSEGGVLIKEARSKYTFKNERTTHTISRTGQSSEWATITAISRLLSLALRHGAKISYIVEQLEKTEGDFTAISKLIVRVLKKYIKDGEKVSGERCPNCGAELCRKEGCKSCLKCGYSACS